MAKKVYKSVEDYINSYYKTREKFLENKWNAGLEPDSRFRMTQKAFRDKILSKMNNEGGEFTIEKAKASIKSFLNTRKFTSEAELIHRNVINKLRDEGIYRRLYDRKGGASTAFWNSSWTSQKGLWRKIEGKKASAQGFYTFGTVKVFFWTISEGSDKSIEQWIEYVYPDGSSRRWQIKGEAVEL